MGKIRLSSKSSDLNYPSLKPTLDLNFAASKSLDPRITFTRNSTATYVGSDGLIKIAVENEPRFEHDPVTGKCLGLMVEGSRTNLITYSEDFTDRGGGIWEAFNSSVITNQIASPLGTITADKLIALDGIIRHTKRYVFSSVANANTSYSFTIFVKPAEYNYVVLSASDSSNSAGRGYIYNLITGEVQILTSASAGYSNFSANCVIFPNGWGKCTITWTNGTTGNIANVIVVAPCPVSNPGVSNADRTASYQGDGNSGVYIWGAQLEGGSFPTSYIPTSGSIVTRQADVAQITGTNFSSWYNTSEGTLLSIGETPASYILSSSLNIKSNSSTTKTVSNLLYYPKTIQNATLRTMNAYTNSIVTDGLVLHLDAGNTISYSGSGTVWTDLSGQSNNGTLVNGVVYNSSNEGSLVFDGINDFSVASTLPTRDGIFTNEIVFYPTSLLGGHSGWSTLMFFSTSTLRSFYFIFNSSGAIGTSQPNATYTTDINYFSSNGLISINNWYHAVQILDKPNNILKMYLNGSLVVNVSPGTHTVTTTSTVTFAQQDTDSSSIYARRMTGRISNAKIYNRALTEAEIQQNFNALRGRFGL